MPIKKTVIACIYLSVIILLFFGMFLCSKDSSKNHVRPTHIFLIVFDTLRADHLGCYGYSLPVSPTIDQLARDGMVFDSAVSLSSWTKPSTVTLLTSICSSDHMVGYFQSRIPSGTTTLANELRNAGFNTLGFIANGNVTARFGFDKGFDDFRYFGAEIRTESQSPEIYNEVLHAIDHQKNQFFYLHLIGPHAPYCPPLDARLKFSRNTIPEVDKRQQSKKARFWFRFDSDEELSYLEALYDSEIYAEDTYLGNFMDGLKKSGIYDTSLIVFTSDHGEAFNEHGKMEHGNNLYGEEIHVPLIFHGHGIPRQRRDDIAGLHDVAPTILNLARVPVPDTFQGTDLTEPVSGNRVIRLREFKEVPHDEEWYGIIYKNMKASWTESMDKKLFFTDWKDETPDSNTYKDNPSLFDKLKAMHVSNKLKATESVELDEEILDSLKNLGYIE